MVQTDVCDALFNFRTDELLFALSLRQHHFCVRAVIVGFESQWVSVSLDGSINRSERNSLQQENCSRIESKGMRTQNPTTLRYAATRLAFLLDALTWDSLGVSRHAAREHAPSPFVKQETT